MKRIAIPVMAAAIALVCAAGAAAAAVSHIEPHQFFAGIVNGRSTSSLISVTGCSANGGNGHPLAGQSAEVTAIAPPPASPAAFTGNAHRISVDLEVPSSDPMLPLIRLVHLGVLSHYDTPLAISTFVALPCHGSATAVFSPVAGGSKAVSSNVHVTFVSPRIVATPSQGTPGTVISLTGTGFAPNAAYHVAECSQTGWVVTQNPCVAGNGVDVKTGPAGRFSHSFTIEACAAGGPTAGPQTCFVGVPMISGVDTEQLVAAARITVVTG